MKKLFLLAALCVAAAFSSCSKHDNEINHVEPPVPPETTPLAIAFAEGNSLEFDVDETKIVHYTITGGSDKTVVKAEMQKSDDAYTVETTPTSATEGTIAITAKMPLTNNCVLVTVSDGTQSITAEIVVSTKSIPEELVITFAEGNSLEFNVNETKTVHYTITGGSDKTVVKAEMQNLDDAYTLKTTPASATEGTIAITAKTPKTENCVIVIVSDGTQSITAEITVSTKPIPEELVITFTEGNSLQFDVDETKIVHYTITGGSENTVVTAEMQNPDDAYTVETTSTSATEGTIAITAKTQSIGNSVLVTVSDGDRSVTVSIDITVTLKTSFDGKTVVVETPGTLSQLLAGYDTAKITELTVIGNLNDEDIATLKNLANLAVLDMENVNLEELPYRAFYKNTSLKSVKLPRTLKSIGGSAFSGCSNLTSVTIPDSVTSIGDAAFGMCSSLTSITIPEGVTTIGVSVFYYCYSLKSVTLPNSVTSIGDNAFNKCYSLTSITIPDSVTTIGSGAFVYCSSLTSITIPDSVTSIGDAAFGMCISLTSVTIGNGVTTIGSSAFAGCSRLTSITIPDSVTSIGKLAFDGCSKLTSITMGNGVTTIGTLAFRDCSSLTSITIGNGVTTIGESAFKDCSSLTSITIPDSVTTIKTLAFENCSSLTSIYCKAQTPPSVGNDAFWNIRVLPTLYVPTGCKAVYAAAYVWKEFTTIEEVEF